MKSETQALEWSQSVGILFAIGDYPDGGATAMRLRLMAQAINKGRLGIQIALLQSTAKTAIPGNENIEGVLDGVPYRYLSGRTVRPASVSGAIRDTLAGIVSFLQLVVLRKERPAFIIFYTPTFWKMIIPMLFAKMRGIPVFIEACEVWSSIPKEDLKGIGRRAMASGDRWLERWAHKIASGIIPISHNIANFYRLHGVPKERQFLLPILVDMELYQNISDAEIKSLKSIDYFLSSGSFGEKDGLPYMLEAFELIADDFPAVCLVFTGSASDEIKSATYDLLQRKDLWDKIIFTGFIDRDQLVWAYQNARALLCCRSNSKYANYGFPTKLGEYLATASPVIVTQVGDVDCYLEDEKSAYIAAPEASQDIAKCLRKVMTNKDLAKRIGNEGKKIAEKHFSHSVYSNDIAQFLRSHS